MQKRADEESALLNAERRTRILEMLKIDGKVIAGELSNRFGVSEDTIRRDLRELADDGLLLRVHGGALPRTPTSPSHAAREGESTAAKRAIAKAAFGLLRDGQVIIIDGGTTPLRVAEQLPVKLRLTVVTHAPAVALALAGHPNVRVELIGGTLFKDSLTTVGSETVDSYRRVRADACILGFASLHPQTGIGVFNADDAAVKRAMAEGSAEVIAVAGGEKIGTRSPFIVGPMSLLTHLVTDASADKKTLAACRQARIVVTKVNVA